MIGLYIMGVLVYLCRWCGCLFVCLIDALFVAVPRRLKYGKTYNILFISLESFNWLCRANGAGSYHRIQTVCFSTLPPQTRVYNYRGVCRFFSIISLFYKICIDPRGFLLIDWHCWRGVDLHRVRVDNLRRI